MLIERKYIRELIEVANFSPVIGILGPRQVGKTTLVKQFMTITEKECIYIDLERPSDYEKMNEAEFYFSSRTEKCIIIDEIQIRPELFSIIRSAVDENRTPLRFIILGSATPNIIRHSSQSLAGRISYIELKPFSLTELSNTTWQQLHFWGGFPESILATKEQQASRWLSDFIKTYIERDFPLLGFSASPVTIRRLWEMVSWQNGNLLNASSIGQSLGFSNHTIKKYIDFLEGAFMINTLSPYAVNIKKRVVKSPKIYIADTGVLHRLMRVNTYDELLGMPFLGASFESFVLQQIIAEKSSNLELFFYRTHAGAEIDIVITKAMIPIASIEVKYSSAPKVSKGFYSGVEDLNTKQNFVIVPETETYKIKNGALVVGIKEFLSTELEKIAKS
jgi:predicted AAA+ superfamily ATPase